MRGTHDTFELDAILRHIASSQLGLITTAQAARMGVDRNALSRRAHAGALTTVYTGVWRLTATPEVPQQRHLAAALAVPESVIAATSAAFIHGMPATSTDDPVLSIPNDKRARLDGVVTLRQTFAAPSRKWLTTRLATPASSIVLLPRFVDAMTVERCLDHCLAARLATVKSIGALLESIPTRAISGRRLLLDLLSDRSDGTGHRSGIEQRVGGWLRAAGLRRWKRNLLVTTKAGGIEVDFAWPSQRLALEVSPFFTHGSRAKQERDAERRRALVVTGWRVVEALDPDVASRRAFARTVSTLRSLGAA